ncbi:MAG: DUF6713 family protein [Bacteroidia bacterium]|nr:DUF6713 family protein [Bacteroidia bacterium]
MLEHFFFYLAFAFILMHEMDAIRCREWRIFPGLSMMDEKVAFPIFMFIHIPLYYFPIHYLQSLPDPESLIRGLDYFFIIHLFLHLLFLKHKNNEFKDWISWTIIIGCAGFGALDLLMKV